MAPEAQTLPRPGATPRRLAGSSRRNLDNGGSHKLQVATSLLAWAWLALVVVIWGLLKLAGDRWWPATLLTFGPRWVVLLPLLILIPAALLFQRRALVPLGVAALLGAGPVMGLCLTWPGLTGALPVENRPIVRVVTYNAGEGGANVDRVCDFIGRSLPDVFVVDEWKNSADDLLPHLGPSWHAAEHQMIAVFSRFPISAVERLGPDRFRKPWRAPALRCELATPAGPIWVVGLHLDTPREGLDAVRRSPRRAGAGMELMATDRRHESELASELAHMPGCAVIVAGDFNMPVDSAIYRQYWSGWQNAYSTVGLGYGLTKYTRLFGARIDHVLANEEWRVLSAQVGSPMGGDHRPLQVDLQRR